MAGVFDVPSRADPPAAVLCTSGTALPKVKLEPEVVVAGTQVEQEERVTGDTPPARLGCAVPMLENDLLRASRVKFDTLSSGAARLRKTDLWMCCWFALWVCWRSWTSFVARVCWRPWTPFVALAEALSGFVLACIVSGR